MWVVAATLLAASLVATYLLVWVAQKNPESLRMAAQHSGTVVNYAILLVLALAAYMALFGCLGAWLPHGERWGVVFCFGWEWLITYLPARIKWMTLMYHVQTLLPPERTHETGFFTIRGEPLSKPTCVAILLIVTIVSVALTVWNVKRREIR